MVLTEQELKKAISEAKTDSRISEALCLRQETKNFSEQAACDREIQRSLSTAGTNPAYKFNCCVVHEPWKFKKIAALSDHGWNERGPTNEALEDIYITLPCYAQYSPPVDIKDPTTSTRLNNLMNTIEDFMRQEFSRHRRWLQLDRDREARQRSRRRCRSRSRSPPCGYLGRRQSVSPTGRDRRDFRRNDLEDSSDRNFRQPDHRESRGNEYRYGRKRERNRKNNDAPVQSQQLVQQILSRVEQLPRFQSPQFRYQTHYGYKHQQELLMHEKQQELFAFGRPTL